MNPVAISLLALALGVAGAAGGYATGHRNGVTAEAAKRDGRALKDMTELLDSHKRLVKAAGEASVAMRKATAARAQHDEKTTQELRDALARTESSRAGCVFPADVMRQLTDAQQRAAAAAAGGVRGAVPGATGPAGP